MNDPRLALAGFVTGLLVGMTGMGGGSLMTPILIFFFNFNPSTAIGTDILHGAIFKSFGAVRHRRLGHGPGAPGCVDAPRQRAVRRWSASGWRLPDRPLRGRGRLGAGQVLGYMLLFGGGRIRRQGSRTRTAPRSSGGSRAPRPGHRRLDRVVGGFIVGLTSVGSGTLFASPCCSRTRWREDVVGTDIVHAAALLCRGHGPPDRRNVDLARSAGSWSARSPAS